MDTSQIQLLVQFYCSILAIVVPWTDKYQPTHSSEIIGNSNNVKKLKAWLIEWKHRVGKENRKMRKIMMKERKNKSKDKGLLINDLKKILMYH